MSEACCGKKGTMSKLRGLAISIKEALSHAVNTGEVVAPYETIEKRLEICDACPEKMGPRCRVCGCLLPIKTGLVTSTCPLKKW